MVGVLPRSISVVFMVVGNGEKSDNAEGNQGYKFHPLSARAYEGVHENVT